jgi:hypothetical protein
MNRHDAYALLCRELEAWKQRPYAQLVSLVGQPPKETAVPVGHEEVLVSVRVRWEHETKRTLRLEAIAYGPSCWKLERLEESIVVHPAHPHSHGLDASE